MTWQDHVVETDARTFLWEILVPTEKRVKTQRPGVESVGGDVDFAEVLDAWKKRNSYTTRYHRVWDEKVRAITGGLTIMQPVNGQWISNDGELYAERNIPVRLAATRAQIDMIIEMTIEYYDQLAVMCYKISDLVILKHRGT